MKKIAFIVLTTVAAFFVSLPLTYAQAEIATPVPGASMIHDFRAMANDDSSPYPTGGNSPERRGCVLNLCPEMVSIDKFSFGNRGDRGDTGSQLQYVWTVKSKSVAAFSISTIEYDPFGNPLPRQSWILPIDDNGNSRTVASYSRVQGGPPVVVDGTGFLPDQPYLSFFDGAGTSADLLEHSTAESILPEKLSKLIKPEIFEKIFGKPTGEVHPLLLQGLWGRSTRFTVVTFVSHIRFTTGKVWDASIPYTISYSWGFEQNDKLIETAALDSLLMYYGEHQPKP